MNKRHRWTSEEIEILKTYYPNEGIYKCMEKLPYLRRSQIEAKINSIPDIKSNKIEKWTEDEINKLIELWSKATKKELLDAFPNRTFQKLQSKAHTLKLHCEVQRNGFSDLNFLKLENLSPQSAYWWGFIMADGHIRKEGNLIISLNVDDKDYLQQLASKLNAKLNETQIMNSFTNSTSTFVRLSVSNKKIISEWVEVLNMTETAKTYFPPNLDVFDPYFIYFFLGFVDGDGSIWLSRNYPQLKIENHISWKSNLDKFAQILRDRYKINSAVTKIGNKNTAILTIANRDDIIKLSKYCRKVDYLHRKWDKILNLPPIVKKHHRVLDIETNIEYNTMADCERAIGKAKGYTKRHPERFKLF